MKPDDDIAEKKTKNEMKIIIAGAGDVGTHLAKMLSNNSNSINYSRSRRRRHSPGENAEQQFEQYYGDR